MNLNDLKLFSMFYTNEHESLTKQQKLQIIDFIKEANEDQVYNLLITGKITSVKEAEKIDPEMVKILKESSVWSSVGGISDYSGATPGQAFHQGVGQGAGAAFATSAIVAGAAVLAVKLYKRFLSKAAKACNRKTGTEKTLCMNIYKKKALQAKATAFQQAKSKCSKSKNPTKCKASLDRKIKSIQAQTV